MFQLLCTFGRDIIIQLRAFIHRMHAGDVGDSERGVKAAGASQACAVQAEDKIPKIFSFHEA